MHIKQDENQVAVAAEETASQVESAVVASKGRLVKGVKIFYWRIASKYRRFMLYMLNPSRLLRTLLLLLFLGFLLLIMLSRGWLDWIPAPQVSTLKSQISPVDWVPTTTIYFAVSGWLVNAAVTIRNSVKQHTINTLLQSRLSKTYMDEADKARAALKDYAPDKVAPILHIKDHPDKNSIDYILNYIEFIAVGVRHGDLHEGVMKDSLRGIVLGFTHVTSLYIQDKRLAPDSRTFENLLWLRNRWKR